VSATTKRVRGHLLSEEFALLDSVVDCADAVAARWTDETTADRAQVVPPLETVLARAGVTEQLPGLLARCVAAAGYDLTAPPVAAPPYVVVTATGPVLRATFDPGRLVISLRVFEVGRANGPDDGDTATANDERRYRRCGETPAEIVTVELRS
jgi:hypothetical protein